MVLGDGVQLARVSVALRAVPGEYDLAWVGPIAQAARHQPEAPARSTAHDVQSRLSRLDAALQTAQANADAMANHVESASLKAPADLASFLLGRLRAGWNASGLWSHELVGGNDAAEVEAIEDELYFRLRSIERATRLRAGELTPSDAQRLEQLCADLAVDDRSS